MTKALLIIDVQNDYFPLGKCTLYQPDLALKIIKKLLTSFRKNHLPVFYVQHLATKESFYFVPETEGVHIHKNIVPNKTETVIIKKTPNSFFETNLQSELKKAAVTDLVICGMMTHMCIDSTVRAAKEYGYTTTLISDACATKDLEWNCVTIPANTVQHVFLASLNQKFATVLTSEEYFCLP